jgi:hypothetical protein
MREQIRWEPFFEGSSQARIQSIAIGHDVGNEPFPAIRELSYQHSAVTHSGNVPSGVLYLSRFNAMTFDLDLIITPSTKVETPVGVLDHAVSCSVAPRGFT